MQKKMNSSIDVEVKKCENQNEDKITPTKQTAKGIAEIMAANMAANMQNSNFLNEQESLKDEVRSKIIEQRRKREGKRKKKCD
ncbi:hypothetical protein [Candidatus Lokiarchaeum ossiferum]|uniref:hypothetical protein n=1 Tax=Candidatus Lokiarchaeum ossiferum TaxID=2951803 RepID=UPI00352D6F86